MSDEKITKRIEPEEAVELWEEMQGLEANIERLRELLKECQPYIEAYDHQWVCGLIDEIKKEVGDET